MARGKKHTAERIVNLLRQVEVGVANGKTLPQACKEVEIIEQTYYRWRKEYGGLKVDHAQEQGLSERRACRLVNQPRGTQRYQLTQREDEDRLTGAIVELASQYGRYGYRRITALLKRDGWQVGKDRVERIWRREGLKVPQKQKPRGRLWFNDRHKIFLRRYAEDCWELVCYAVPTHRLIENCNEDN